MKFQAVLHNTYNNINFIYGNNTKVKYFYIISHCMLLLQQISDILKNGR